MIKFVLLALLLLGSDAEIAKQNAQAIAAARAAVRDMNRVAATPAEKTMAKNDGLLVERAAELLSRRAAEKRRAAASSTGDQQKPDASAEAMQEADISFNMQYLRLQSQMQHENRSYTAISNIMKTKHDTVKNSISNIR